MTTVNSISISPTSAPARAPALDMRGISKTFPGVKALDNVQLQAWTGEIHSLMGENGAGKSTLMKILSGAYSADPGGEIRIDGRLAPISGPKAAREAGIAIIYQELSLAPNLTVAENIYLGNESTRFGILADRAAMRRETVKVLERLGAEFGPDTVVNTLSIAEQQQVEIARALHQHSHILIMDEPTTALSNRETDRLFNLIKRLRDEGIAIIYISHRMAEIYELSDRVSVLRDGSYVGTLERAEISAERLVQMMVGRPLSNLFDKTSHATDRVVLEVKELTDGGRRVKPCSLTLRAGEVLGLAGLVGAGRSELARLIFGADRAAGGEVWLEGKRQILRKPLDAINAGIAYLTEDRKAQGLFLDMSVRENITISVLGRDALAGGLLNRAAMARLTAGSIEDLRVRVAGPFVTAGALSGGNQQKLLIARWIAINPKVLILDEPTKGVDIGAKAEIYRIISELAAKGVAILVISSELPEVIGISDRILVMREGRIVGELGGSGDEAATQANLMTQENIMALATGTTEMVQP
ncbi:MAG: sugar ABC transporter ATP-binding protein [Candidatus Contendobacter sp.]|nr:sugar ABC transporter ATP-binding protein [Candidatus Contendobacter sp.]